MYPGQGHRTYGQGPPPPPQQYGYHQGPPPGPPPPQFNQGYQQGYQQSFQQQGYQQGYGRPVQSMPPNYSQGQPYNQGDNRNFNAPQSMHRPPSSVQQLSNTGFNYQYSQCNGQRKALLIGINYFGSQSQLRGCINDANAMKRFLMDKYGYRQEDMVILTDDQRDQRSIPTRANIIRAMQWLVSDARPNDSLVFHYSGHGGLEKNLTGEEESGYDSCIYPVDFQVAGSIIDDVMHDVLVRPLPAGARLTAFFDSCHSGSALDLPFAYSTKGVIKEPNMLKDVGKDGLNAVMSYAEGNISGVVSSLSSAFTRATRGESNRQQVIIKNSSPADVIMLSGSKDDQTSADTTEYGMATGAMSYSFINVMASQPEQSYISLLNNMRAAMSGKYSQKPQLSASHPIDVNLKFIM